MYQVLFRVPLSRFELPIFGFGAMLCVAFVVCTWLGGRRAARAGYPPPLVQDLAICLFAGGVLGARVLYLLQEADPPPASLADFLLQLPRIWDGGLILYGSVIGGVLAYALAYLLYFRRRGVSTLKLADIVAPSVALGICFGRLGCFLNGCCYGQVACADCAAVYPVHFPLPAPPRYALTHAGYQTAAGFTLAADQPDDGARVGRVEPGSAADAAGLRPGDLIVRADGVDLTDGAPSPAARLDAHLVAGWPRGQNRLRLTVRHAGSAASGEPEVLTFSPRTLGLHPTQLYESVSMFLLFLLLTAYYPLRSREGLATAVLMMGYALHRSLNELLRDDPRPVGLERYFSYYLFAAGLALALALLWRGPRVTPAPPQPAPAPA
jgi:prolipoprotein diacylglyceryltransferase